MAHDEDDLLAVMRTELARSTPAIEPVTRTEEQKRQMMSDFARSFPALKSKFQDAESNGLHPWNFLQLVRASRQWSTSEKLIVSFLATVWNYEEAKDHVEAFNVVEAAARLDARNWTPIARWAERPFRC